MGKHDALHGIAKHEREAHLGQSKPQTTTHDMKFTYYRWGKKTSHYGYIKVRYIKRRKLYKVWRLYPNCEDAFYGRYYPQERIDRMRKLASRPSLAQLKATEKHNAKQNSLWTAV